MTAVDEKFQPLMIVFDMWPKSPIVIVQSISRPITRRAFNFPEKSVTWHSRRSNDLTRSPANNRKITHVKFSCSAVRFSQISRPWKLLMGCRQWNRRLQALCSLLNKSPVFVTLCASQEMWKGCLVFCGHSHQTSCLTVARVSWKPERSLHFTEEDTAKYFRFSRATHLRWAHMTCYKTCGTRLTIARPRRSEAGLSEQWTSIGYDGSILCRGRYGTAKKPSTVSKRNHARS